MAYLGNPNPYEFSDDADSIILRSSDNVDFYVVGAFLRHVSLVFKDMFASARGDSSEKKDNLPVVPVAEDSETLRLLLDIIYPYEEEPQLSSPAVVWKVSKATQKYMMDMIERKLKRLIAKSKLITENSLSIYAIAIDLEWEGVAIKTARQMLKTPLETLTCVDELHFITGAGFYRFLEYKRQCENSRNPKEEVLPPLRREKDSIKIRTSSFDHIDFATASEPYTCSELSDPILWTSDGVGLYVVSAFLRLSSPFFNRKFPLKNPVTKDGLAVIDVQEDSNILRLLLAFIYPTQEPEIQSAGLYAQLVFAARKYDMIDIENKVKKHATASFLVTAEPLRVYAVASALGWTSLAKMAALNTLHTPFQEMSYGDEMHLMTGAQLFSLMRFRFACATAACDVLLTGTLPIIGCLLSKRLRACPRGSTVTNAYDQEMSKSIAEDGFYAISMIYKLLRHMQETPKAVEEVVSKVDLLTESPASTSTGPKYRPGAGTQGAKWQVWDQAREQAPANLEPVKDDDGFWQVVPKKKRSVWRSKRGRP